MTPKEAIEARDDLIASGKLIESGWFGFGLDFRMRGVPEPQVRDLRLLFFAGAQHVLATLMEGVTATPTDADQEMFERRVRLFERELRPFMDEFRFRFDLGNMKAKGSA